MNKTIIHSTDSDYRRCPLCGELKPLSPVHFADDKTAPFGISKVCRRCEQKHSPKPKPQIVAERL